MMVSVIIPCYNDGHFIKEAIDSVLACRQPGVEIIVVNDGSTDTATQVVLNSLQGEGLTVMHQANQGLAAARNNGIAAAMGKYILPLDSDNKVHPNYLTKAVKLLERNPAIDVVFGNPMFFGDEDGLRQIPPFDIGRILRANYIDACAVYRKTVWEKVGGYDGKMPAMGNEDWEFWINIHFHGGGFAHMNDVGFYYRTRPDSMTITTTRPGGTANIKYVYAKHSEKIVDLYVRQKRIVDYINSNRIKALAKLLLGQKF